MEQKKTLAQCKYTLLAGIMACAAFPAFANANASTQANAVSQQQNQRTITGQVVDATGQPIIGASVVQKGNSGYGTLTDIDGKFSLQLPKGAVLQVSYVGYQSVDVAITATNEYNITLREENESLNEVVVVGYGTQKKVNLTGSIATVGSAQLENRTSTSVSNMLVGMMPGVTVMQSSGQPGSDGASLTVRGIGTMNSGSSPMVLIDGVEGSLGTVNPNDVESISVLKDAAASAIYGVRAANGVVLVTTKKGAEGKAKVQYNAYIGWQQATRIPKFANSYEYAMLMNEAYANDGSKKPYTDEDLQKFKDGSDPEGHPDSDWLGTLFSENGLTHNHHLSVNGGSKAVQYAVSLGYHYKNGLIPNTNFKRYTFRSNVDAQVNKRLKVTLNLAGNYGNQVAPADGIANIIHYAYREIPVSPIQAPDGNYVYFKNEHNSILSAKESGKSTSETYRFVGTGGMEFAIIDGLKLRGSASARYGLTDSRTHSYSKSYYSPGNYENLKQTVNSIANSDSKSLEITLQAYLDYNKTFGQHTVAGLLGYQQVYDRSRSLYAYRKNLPNSNTLDQINAGEQTGQQTSGTESEYALRSVFGRVNYSYADRYLAEFNLRYDGTSRFPKNHRFGAFPSVSVGWRISEEAFFKADWVDNLKVRASWGVLGNQEIGNYSFYETYTFQNNYSINNTIQPTISVNSTMPNTDIKWEKTEQVNIGVDTKLWKGLLTASFDYFRKDTKDILLNLPTVDMIGVYSPYQNAGRVLNTGFELQLGHSNRIGELQYDIQANVGYVKTTIKDLKGADTPGQSVGDPLSAWYGYVCEGIFRTQADIDNHADQSGFGQPQLGDLMYKDTNGDNKVDSNDRVILGSLFPKWNFGLNISASYKGFDFSTMLQGAADVKDMAPAEIAYAFYNGGKLTAAYLDRWTTENPNGSMPRLSMTNSSNRKTSSFWVTDASYVKMRNLQVGYTLPRQWLSSLGVSRLRLYYSMDNVFTITSFKGVDPEASGNVHPMTRTYSFGINLAF